MFRSTETFALTRRRFRDFRPLLPPPSYASPLLCAPHHALARRATERSEEARQPSACRLPFSSLRTLIPYSLVSRETCEHHPRPQPGERARHAPGLPAPPSRPPLAALTAPPALMASRSCNGDRYSLVSRETNEHRPLSRSRTRAPVVPAQ